MFEEGDLLHFDPFYFEDGTSKKKYFLVLKNENGMTVLASLPTSKDHIPADMDVHAGCFEFSDRGINAYVFMAGDDIAINPSTGQHFSFSQNTFVYGANLDMFPLATFVAQQLSGQTNVTVKGKINQDIFDDLIKCLKQSSSVKNKYKRML